MKTFGFIISFFLFSSSVAFGQDQILLHPDSVKGKFIPTGIRIGTELINIGRSLANEDLTEYTFTADIDFHRYFLNIEFGNYDRSFEGLTGSLYSVSGNYFRVGPDINFLKKDPDGNALFFGLRYGWTRIKDELTFTSTSDFFDNSSQSLRNDGLSANWGEIVTGLKVKVWKMLWLGYTARFRFGSDNFEREELIPHYVPGYGRADKTVSWGLNYWVMVRIPLRTRPQFLFPE